MALACALGFRIGTNTQTSHGPLFPEPNNYLNPYEPLSLSTSQSRDVYVKRPKCPNGLEIQIRNLPALDPQKGFQIMVLGANIIQILLEILIDFCTVRFSETTLFFVIAVPKIMAITTWKEVKSLRFIGGFAIAIGGPDEGGVAVCFCIEEVFHGELEEDDIGVLFGDGIVRERHGRRQVERCKVVELFNAKT
jgi:hypothetical protein